MSKLRWVVLQVFIFLVVGCAALSSAPRDTTIAERLSHFPRSGLRLVDKATVRWNENLIPFIEAANEGDAAYLFGMTHAFLRIGQMEILRRASQGRLSESAGPLTIEIDKALRIFAFGHAAEKIIAAMPPATRRWVDRYLEGINDYIELTPGYVPADLKAANIVPSPWKLPELVTVWRLASADVNWMVLLGSLLESDKPWHERLWKASTEVGTQSVPSFGEFQAQNFRWLFQATETGSNSLLIGAKRSASGAPLIASDPHLGLTIPNFWVLVALSYPGSRAIGLSIPGIPFIALGRSEHAAWGGTNMWGISTTLHSLTPEELSTAESHEEKIAVRGWFDTTVKIRRTRWGPVITDAPMFKDKPIPPIAVRWMGHEISDEISGFLNASRAKTFDAFRAGLADYAVSAQNLLFADRTGNFGHVLAYRQPLVPKSAVGKVFSETSETWKTFRRPTELPFFLNPKQGFLVSANNVPVRTEPPIGSFFQSSERFSRLTDLASHAEKTTVKELMQWQLDTHSPSSLALLGALLPLLPESEEKKKLAAWDGRYEEKSSTTVLAEFFLIGVASRLFEADYGSAEVVPKVMRNSAWKTVARKSMERRKREELAPLVDKAFAEAKERSKDFATWGDARRVRAAHLFANIPVVGSRWRFEDAGADGGSDTVFKSSTAPKLEKAYADYGSNARHVSDLGNIDENYFCLFGGQDGWLRSPATLDQFHLWREKKWLRLPLSPEAVKAAFPTVMTF